uniref:Gag protein n=1 Tax=Knipowitschia caucasica TaxID=637954 RepID=A0AAV2L6N7_KNICA
MAEDECKYVPPWTQGVCNVRVDPFCGDGRKLFATWIKQFEAAVRAQTRGDGRSYATSLSALLPTRLDGAAFLLWDSLPSSVQRASLELYAADLSRLVAEAFPEYDKMAQNAEKFRRFLAGLDPELRAQCPKQGATDLEKALMIAATVASLSAAEGTALGTFGVTGKLPGAVERLTDRMDKLQMEVVNLRAQRSDHTPRTSQGFPCACECGGFGCRSSAREHRVECNGRAPRYGSRNTREWSPQAQEDRGAAPDYPHRREEDETPRRGRFSVEPEWRRGLRFLSPSRRSPSRRSPSRRSPSPSPIRRNQGNDQ